MMKNESIPEYLSLNEIELFQNRMGKEPLTFPVIDMEIGVENRREAIRAFRDDRCSIG